MLEKLLYYYNLADNWVSGHLLIPEAIIAGIMFVSIVLGVVSIIKFSFFDPKKNIFLLAKKKRDDASKVLYKAAMQSIKPNTATSFINILFPGKGEKAKLMFISFFVFIPAVVIALMCILLVKTGFSVPIMAVILSAIGSVDITILFIFYGKKKKDFEQSLYNAMYVLNNRLKLSNGEVLTAMKEAIPFIPVEFKKPFIDFFETIGTKGAEKSFYTLRTIYNNEFYKELCDILRLADFNGYSPEESITELQESILVNTQDTNVTAHQRTTTAVNIFLNVFLSVGALLISPMLHDKLHVSGLPAVYSIIAVLIAIQIFGGLLAVGNKE